MFKNTFEELESLFEDKGKVLNSLLRVFAVYPSKSIDIYSICIITDFGYQDILPMMRLLCKYLILEKKEEKYSLNPFAEKYIIQKLLPDVTESQKMANDISRSLNEIKDNLKKLEKDLNDNPNIKNIISDWSIEYDGDKIVAAKMYAVYSDANKASQMGDPFHVNTSYDSFSKTVEKIESTTMHPYVKYQKARILQVFLQTKVDLGIKNENICVAFDECIWAIKTNGLYAKIMGTKTYASIMWIYGLFLSSILRNKEAIKYLEEAKRYFEEIECFDGEYYQCICKLASEYINEYEKEKIPDYIQRAKPIGDILYNNIDAYSGDKTTKYIATEINKKLKCYKI